jgi:hypothetical protein
MLRLHRPYNNFTRCSLEPILCRPNEVEPRFNNIDINTESVSCNDLIDQLHDDIITVLSTATKLYVGLLRQENTFISFGGIQKWIS